MSKPHNVTLIACMGYNGVIGRDGGMPWHFPSDLGYFRDRTMGNTVVMGGKTFDGVGKLPDRVNIVLSRTPRPDVLCLNSVEDVMHEFTPHEMYIAGGARVYKEFLPIADTMVLTTIHKNYEGDTYFPEFPAWEWDTVKLNDASGDIDGVWTQATRVEFRRRYAV